MEDGDISLEKEIEELTLDRPPGSVLGFGGTETVVEDIFKDVPKTDNEGETIISSRLATCLIDKPLSCQAQGQDQDVTFDPLSSSERNFYTDTENSDIVSDDVPEFGSGHVPEEEPYNERNILHSSDIEQIHVLSSSIQLVQSQPPESKLIEKKSTHTNQYTNSREKLVSCLKGDENTSTETAGADQIHTTKCVCFTDGPGIVTEFIEPVNPWRDMRTPSKGEVVSFYKNVCKKLKCKPLDKVIKQIQESPDLSTRSGTLVLRGCRLDNRSCEALESVFKRVQFENLDLENCSLEEDGATAILEMIEFYHSTCKLNIACNPKVGLRGWQALCRMLRKTPCLTYLDARRTILTEMTMPTFGRCLKADPYLKVLHLEGVFLSGRPLLILTTALKYNRLLEELYLGDNDLTSNDGPSLGAMLTYNTTLQLLDLRNNQIKDIGLAHIGNGLSDQTEQPCGGLCSLIMWNNGLTHEGMTYLCEGLVKTTTLKALNLGQNRITDLGVQKLKGGLMKNKSLRKLGFLNTKLGSEGAVALAEVLADSWSITRIDIRENNIQTAGLMAFAMALKVNQSLLRLDLDKDIRKEPGMETVTQSVLVDIYNLCYRNKNLLRKSITPSQSASSCSIGTVVSRQSSSSSELNEPFSYDDVFHPEAVNHDVTPYSPTVCSIDNPIDVNAGIMFSSISNTVSSKVQIDSSDSTESLGNSISAAFESVKRGRAYSDPVKNNPDPAPNGRRGSRFSVTKILDSLGTHAQGVASKFAQIDNKLKKQHSKDKMDGTKTSELVPVLDQNQPIELDQLKSRPINDDVEGNVDANNCNVSVDEINNRDLISTSENSNIDTITPEDPTNTATLSTDEPTNTDTINTVEPTNTDTINTDEPTNTDKINTDEPTNTHTINTDEPTNTDTINTDEAINTDTINTEEPINTDIINTDEFTNTDTISTDERRNSDTMDDEATNTDKNFTIADGNDNVNVILTSELKSEGCVKQTDIFDTCANKIEGSNNKNFDSEVKDVMSTLVDNNTMHTNLTSKCVNISASLDADHSMSENMCATGNISKGFYEEQTVDYRFSSQDAGQIPDDSDISQINSGISELACDSPDNGSMENLLIDDKLEKNWRTIGEFTPRVSDTTTMNDEVKTTHCIDDKFEDISSRTEVNENNINDLQPNHHERSQEDSCNQLTDINLNENNNFSDEPTLLDSVKLDDCTNVLHDGNAEKNEVHDGDGENSESSRDCKGITEIENIVSDAKTVGDGACVTKEIDNDCEDTSNQCSEDTDDCVLAVDTEEPDKENLVNVKLINENLDIKLNDVAFGQGHLSDVEPLGIFSQHTIFGQPVSVDLPS